jgi:hypothetical protein
MRANTQDISKMIDARSGVKTGVAEEEKHSLVKSQTCTLDRAMQRVTDRCWMFLRQKIEKIEEMLQLASESNTRPSERAPMAL